MILERIGSITTRQQLNEVVVSKPIGRTCYFLHDFTHRNRKTRFRHKLMIT